MAFSKLTIEERETTISYNEADGFYTIATDVQKHIRKFDRLNYECVNTIYYPDGTVETKEYKVPEWAVSFRKPEKVKISMTEEQKAAAAERLKLARVSKTSNQG